MAPLEPGQQVTIHNLKEHPSYEYLLGVVISPSNADDRVTVRLTVPGGAVKELALKQSNVSVFTPNRPISLEGNSFLDPSKPMESAEAVRLLEVLQEIQTKLPAPAQVYWEHEYLDRQAWPLPSMPIENRYICRAAFPRPDRVLGADGRVELFPLAFAWPEEFVEEAEPSRVPPTSCCPSSTFALSRGALKTYTMSVCVAGMVRALTKPAVGPLDVKAWRAVRADTYAVVARMKEYEAMELMQRLHIAVEEAVHGEPTVKSCNTRDSLGELLESQKNFAAAAKVYKEGIAALMKIRNPTAPKWKLALAWSYLGLAYKRNEEYVKAAKAYEAGLKHVEDSEEPEEEKKTVTLLLLMTTIADIEPSATRSDSYLTCQLSTIVCRAVHRVYPNVVFPEGIRFFRTDDWLAVEDRNKVQYRYNIHADYPDRIQKLGKGVTETQLVTNFPRGAEPEGANAAAGIKDTMGAHVGQSAHGALIGQADCDFCGSVAKEGQKWKICGGCKKARYCSSDCQRKDWKAHKALCKSLQQ